MHSNSDALHSKHARDKQRSPFFHMLPVQPNSTSIGSPNWDADGCCCMQVCGYEIDLDIIEVMDASTRFARETYRALVGLSPKEPLPPAFWHNLPRVFAVNDTAFCQMIDTFLSPTAPTPRSTTCGSGPILEQNFRQIDTTERRQPKNLMGPGSEANCTKPICCRDFSDSPTTPTLPTGPNGNPHCDSPVPLAASMLEAIQRLNPKFSIFIGDDKFRANQSRSDLSTDLHDFNAEMTSKLSAPISPSIVTHPWSTPLREAPPKRQQFPVGARYSKRRLGSDLCPNFRSFAFEETERHSFVELILDRTRGYILSQNGFYFRPNIPQVLNHFYNGILGFLHFASVKPEESSALEDTLVLYMHWYGTFKPNHIARCFLGGFWRSQGININVRNVQGSPEGAA
ncbi:hypothetical protein C8R44DRAFT_755188 [Mycena epipterygia]|nr:hypothetical protein C8R44DRAFT_755188 [Mycena epipterygia]